jgi:rfaE bifunctional protein nucleotidyltransferase chain/domain
MRIGMANGCFDCFHKGHQHFLESAYEHCDYLIVAVNSDLSVRKLKGPDRPIENIDTRISMVQLFSDAVIPFDGYEEGLLVHIKPNVYFRGYDHVIDRCRGTSQVAQGIGCDIVQISHLPGYSTTGILHEAQRNA